nr:pyocin activator PrtN family protein [Pseudogulbenkiania ferrooxidans]
MTHGHSLLETNMENKTNRTAWLLMAQHQTPSIPLANICDEHFGVSIAEANRLATLNKLPLPTYRVGPSRQSPRHVHIDDLAKLIDERHDAARRSWERSQV